MRNRFCLLLSAIASLSIAYSTEAQIAPDGTTSTQVNGNAIAPTGAGTVNGSNLYHSFNDFNVPQSGVIFNTGNSAVNGADVRNIINRVTGDNPSAVLGTIESRQAFPNANLYLMNPNGIVFGQNARLDIGGSFHVTTGTGLGFENGTFNVDKNSLSFPSGDPKTIRFAVSQPAGLINQGNLAVDTGKSITFTGGTIINTGILTAPSGNIALTSVAGNSQVELRSPDAVLGLQVTNNAVPTNWNGKITELPKLAELLTGKVPEANQVVIKADGSLALVAAPAATDIAVSNGMSVISGKIDVSSVDSKAGNVGVFGEKVGLVNAQIDASGALGGGTVLIGGSFQGNGIAPNALRTFVNSSSKIDVSALLSGNGGTAIVWSNLNTRFLGTIVAKGGDLSGDGGFVEVSGKQNLDYRGNVNTLAPNGKIGTLLLDPTNINVVIVLTSAPPGSVFGGLADVDQFSDPNTTTQPGNFLNVGLINGANSNVILQATNDINFNAPVAISALGVGLTAQAGRDINVNNDISTNAGTINLRAGRDIVGTGTIRSSFPVMGTQAGDISLIAGRDVRVNAINAAVGDIAVSPTNGGNIAVQAGGSILTTGTFTAFGNTYAIATNASTSGNAGSISLTSTNGAINVSSGRVHAVATIGNGGNITFQAAGNITTGQILVTGSLGGGSINLTSNNGAITTTGDIDASSTNGNGGNINFVASNSITTTNLNTSSALASGGNISLDPTGDIVLNSANTAGSIQGGNFFASSTGGNIKVIGFVSSPFAACAGASICSASNSGGTGGQIFLSHGGINPFIIGNSSVNGTAGIVTTGSSTLDLGKIITVGTSTFTQGNILIAPSGDPTLTPPSGDPTFIPPSGDPTFIPPKGLVGVNTVDIKTQNLLGIKEVMKKEVDRFLKEENLEKAFQAIEKAYVSELEIFLGESLKPPILSINQAQDTLSDVSKRSGSASVLIYPILLNDRIEILVIPPKELGKPFHRYTNYANEAEIIMALTDYRASLLDTSSQDYLEQAQKLYDWVMRPIDAQLQALKIETVVFVMDSGLRVIPPAALHDGKQFLMERYASANIPALRLTRLEDRDRKNNRILAMGLTQSREGLSALPSVEVEIRTISTQVLAGSSFLDQDFTIRNMQEQRNKSNYGILHFGTHGQFLQDRAKDSYIQFWDGKLRSHQIPSLRFDQPVIEMLTLSACETAVGNNLGISGLAVESGARSILASLWAVSDVGTAPLMISFYKAFPNALSKATALRQAQLDLLKGKVKIVNNQIVGVDGLAAIALPKGTGDVDTSHPFFWSSFILVGNWL